MGVWKGTRARGAAVPLPPLHKSAQRRGPADKESNTSAVINFPNIHVDLFYGHTGYNITSCFRSRSRFDSRSHVMTHLIYGWILKLNGAAFSQAQPLVVFLLIKARFSVIFGPRVHNSVRCRLREKFHTLCTYWVT